MKHYGLDETFNKSLWINLEQSSYRIRLDTKLCMATTRLAMNSACNSTVGNRLMIIYGATAPIKSRPNSVNFKEWDAVEILE